MMADRADVRCAAMPPVSEILTARVRRVVARYALPVPIEAETRLHQELGLDWIHLHDILHDLEDALLVRIPECELIDHLMTFGDLVTLTQMALDAAAAARVAA